MIDLWMSVVWTLLITAATLLADWVAGRIVLLTRGVAEIRRAVKGSGDPVQTVRAVLERIRARQVAGLTWGADLAAIALGPDLAVLGLWMGSNATFPFFQRWDSAQVQRGIGVWLVVLLAHLVVLLTSIILRQLHGDMLDSMEPHAAAQIFHKGWLTQNRWMLAGNALGFLGLLSSFVIAGNAI